MASVNDFEKQSLGNICINPVGDYDSNTVYNYLDAVMYNGGSYVCLKINLSGVSPEENKSNENWFCNSVSGQATADYVAMHDDVMDAKNAVLEDKKTVEDAKAAVQTMESSVTEMHQSVLDAQADVHKNMDTTAGYAQVAMQSKQNAVTAAEAATEAVSGFDVHVAEQTASADQAIASARQEAVSVVASQAETSVKKVVDDTETYIAEKESDALTEIEAKTASAVSEVENTKNDVVSAVTEEGTKQVERVQAEGATYRTDIDANAESIVELKETITNDYAHAIKPTVSGASINITDSADAPIQDLKVYGNSTQDGRPTPDTPIDIVSVGDGGSVDVIIHNKNLIPYPYLGTTQPSNGITWTLNADKTITANGTATADSTFIIDNNTKPYKIGNYISTGCPNGGSESTYMMVIGGVGFDTGSGLSWNVKNDTTAFISCTIKKGTTVNNIVFKPMLVIKGTNSNYESQQKQTITIPLSEPLRGIGDYKDVICEQDGQIGILRNMQELIINGNESIFEATGATSPHYFRVNFGSNKIAGTALKGILSNKFIVAYAVSTINAINILWQDNIGISYNGASNIEEFRTYLTEQYSLNTPVKIVCVRVVPTFEPFSEEIQKQWKALKSYFGITNVINSESANMDCTYVADTKNYIDNKLAELTALALEG